MGPHGGGVYRRIAVTLIAPIAALLVARIPVPGVDREAFEQVLGSSTRDQIGVGSFAIRPFLTAALWVEVLALMIPRWRALRLGGYPERDRLGTRVMVLGLAMVLLQSFFMVRWLRSTATLWPIPGLIHGDPHDPFWIAVQMLSLVAGTCLLYWIARLIDRYGVGNGIAVMIVAFVAEEMGPALFSSVRRHSGESILAPLCLAAVAAAAVTRLAGGRPLKASAQPPGGEKPPAPASGLQPVVAGASSVAIPLSAARLWSLVLPAALTPGTTANRVVEGAVVGALCLLMTWMFNRPRLLAEAWSGGGASDPGAAPIDDRVRAAFARSLALALAICWLVMALDWLCADAQLSISVVNLTVLACVVMDVAGEIRFRRRHAALVPVWPVHRLFMLPVLLEALEAAGIPAFARARHYRTLWNFFAPFVPVDILVPAEHAIPAETILRTRSEASEGGSQEYEDEDEDEDENEDEDGSTDSEMRG